MKIKLLAAVSFLLFVNSFIFAKKEQPAFITSDATNWVYVINNKTLEPTALFAMDNGVLKISDVSAGYLRTKKTYKNFTLTVEWRWTKVAANSGVLIHIQPNDTVWPKCFQVQQKADAAGDIICMNGLWANECTDKVKFTVPKKKPSNEKPLGEWNAMKIISKNGTLEVFVNGELQNKITGMTAKKGFIGFQAEGKPMEFKNLKIK